MSSALPTVKSGVIDPVCGMTVYPDNAAGCFEYNGEIYYFCNPHCLHPFEKDPESFLTKTAAQKPATRAQQYTCPMHPQIIRDGPGSCPICGMALEPLTASLDEEANPELVDMSRRFWFAV